MPADSMARGRRAGRTGGDHRAPEGGPASDQPLHAVAGPSAAARRRPGRGSEQLPSAFVKCHARRVAEPPLQAREIGAGAAHVAGTRRAEDGGGVGAERSAHGGEQVCLGDYLRGRRE